MPAKIEVHTVPHFKAPINAKVDHEGLECGSTFTLYYSLLKIGHLHKISFVKTESFGTVSVPNEQYLNTNSISF